MPTDWSQQEVAALIKDGILEVGDGYRAKNEELTNGAGVPFVRGAQVGADDINFRACDHFPGADLPKAREKVSLPGDVVLTTKGTVGRSVLVRSDMPRFVFSPQLSYWRSRDPSRVDPRFLFAWLRGPEFRRQSGAVKDQTDMAPYVSLRDQRAMTITLPPLAEQRAIGRVLGDLDDKIRLSQRIASSLERMAELLYRQLCDESTAAPGESWLVSDLGALTTTAKGVSYKSSELAPSDVALVTLKSFGRGGGYRGEGLKSFTGVYKQDQALDPGDVIVALTDLTQDAAVVGAAARVPAPPNGYETLVASLDVAVVRPSDGRLTNEVLYGTLRWGDFHSHACGYANGTTVLHLDKRAIDEYRVVVPPIDRVESYTRVARDVFSRVEFSLRQANTLEAIRDTLLPKLVSGDVRIPASKLAKYKGEAAGAV
jgi:type I restriction enzyme, S subunit